MALMDMGAAQPNIISIGDKTLRRTTMASKPSSGGRPR
jgi:hypothetical protein